MEILTEVQYILLVDKLKEIEQECDINSNLSYTYNSRNGTIFLFAMTNKSLEDGKHDSKGTYVKNFKEAWELLNRII